jgi:hypothetical protein
VSSRRFLHHGLANKLADSQAVVLTGMSLPQMVLQ